MADYYEEESKFEAVSKVCGQAVADARLAAKLFVQSKAYFCHHGGPRDYSVAV